MSELGRLIGLGRYLVSVLLPEVLGQRGVVPELDAVCTDPVHAHPGGTYTVPGRCGNCGQRVVCTFSRGHEHGVGPPCPACGTPRVVWAAP